MVAWTDKIYYSENIKERKRAKIRKKIDSRRSPRDIFVIASPTNPETLFDILPAKELFKQFYEKDTVRIAGVAKGREEAEELVREMVEEMYANTGGFDSGNYFFL
ncbi:MAG: hypothetical protein J6U10_09920 [Lachnospiraceae bacterium]|nr:hypothetical protein [Lachnospiraceae bacterium]